MSINQITENQIVTAEDGGKGMANLVYILYIAGFFTGITALIGVILAHTNLEKSSTPYKEHFEYQKRIFIRGLILGAIWMVLQTIVTVIGAATLGLGFILYIIPMAVLLYWAVWTIIRIVKGMQALGRSETIV